MKMFTFSCRNAFSVWIIMLNFCYCFCGEQSMTRYNVVDNNRFGQTIKIVTVDSLMKCSSACSTEDGCVSLSYQASSSTCEMNDRIPWLDGNIQLTSSSGWTSTYIACPVGWTQYFTHCYLFNNNVMTWFAAESFCQGVDADLVDIQDNDEWQFVIDATDGNFIWTGLNDIASEGNFVWSSTLMSPAVDFFDKGDNEPDGGTSQNCVAMHNSNHLWVDIACSLERMVFCKREVR